LILVALAACDDNGDFSFPFGNDAPSADGAPVQQGDGSVQLVERDVEAPEVFQVSESGLWDGRPSLGGVWVAHPDVSEPERVIIRNTENGTFVIGALFRRERENPGPALQVSSDAAAALDMLAGAPAMLNVTALRREEAAAPTATEATGDLAVEPIAEAPEISATSLDPIEGAAAAIEAAETATPAPTPAASSPLDRPYIQLGIFSVEANARNTATSMSDRGIPAQVVAEQGGERPYWRVIVGPAASSAERDRLLNEVKSAGFADAYFVRS
jgi:cell division septation protein DedD